MISHKIANWVENTHLPILFELNWANQMYLHAHHKAYMILFLLEGPQNEQDIKTFIKSANKHDFEISLGYCVIEIGSFCMEFLKELEFNAELRSVAFILEDMDDLGLKHKMYIGQNLDMRKL